MGREIITMVENGEVTVSEALSLLKRAHAGPGQYKHELTKNEKLAAIKQQLDSLIGLHTVKKLVNEIQAYVEIQQRRTAFNLVSEPVVLHSVFIGNPGTGKTTVARIIGQMFLEMGVLQKGHLVEVERADLVAEYIGQTAQRTREQLRKASGGILFIDEAYSLARGGENDFGKEVIDTIVKTMEDQRSNLIVILAGYCAPMEVFLETNPGLRSRFPIIIRFPDYTTFELFRIAEQMLQQREYQLSKAARRRLLSIIENLKREEPRNFGNARTIRNIIEKAVRKQAVRLVHLKSPTRAQLMEIAAEDLQEVDDD